MPPTEPINNQTPAQPAPAAPATVQTPAPAPVQTAPNPAAAPTATQNLPAVPLMKNQGFWFGIASLAFFAIGFFVGYAGLMGVLLGVWAIRRSQGEVTAKVLGGVGIGLNACFYLLVVILNATAGK